LKIFGAKLATDHPDYAVTLNNLALLQVATDRPLEALRRMQEAVEIENRMLSQIFSISSDNQRLTYLQQKRGEFYGFLSLVTQYLQNAPEAVQAAFDLVLRRKALGAEAAAMQRTAILSDRYRHLAPQLEQLRQLDNQIASLAWNVPLPEQLAAYQTQLYVRDLTIAQMRPQWLTPEAITRITDRSPGIGKHLRQLSQKPGNYRPYAHPKYWGAFICQGDATPL